MNQRDDQIAAQLLELHQWRGQHTRQVRAAGKDPAALMRAARDFMARRADYMERHYHSVARALAAELEQGLDTFGAPSPDMVDRMPPALRERYEERLCRMENEEHLNPEGRALGEALLWWRMGGKAASEQEVAG